MTKKKIGIIGVPLDLGQSRRGVDMGPSAIRYAGLEATLKRLSDEVFDFGDIPVSREREKVQKLRHLNEIVEACTALANQIEEVETAGYFPLVLGGDHSTAIGTLAGVAKMKKNLGLIWYDAHGDLNTLETSPSGNIHGMPLAVSLGLGEDELIEIGKAKIKVKPESVVIIGARSLDEGEKALIKQLGIKVFTMHEIDRLGMAHVMEEAIAHVTKGTDGVHLSFDLDALDPLEAPGVGTPVVGGVTYRESHLAMEMLAEAKIITSAEFVEVNPILDEKNITAEAAVALIGSLFGQKLL
ncbi:arginase [Alkalihalobacillus alcalophilus ATCC 27647 = CGMCC 1.3604]|uniref:Arginase n=2 Tax=Alkalihalobacillus alcalophilus TaxID=1445 RepID=A0A4S4JYB7_ALKAL|nr:arginase [Alkalihalobacillus alcalophilus]MED1564329.1 arginase [Alkalihalobacillus alcalophilus]THG90201.1 arginase [Alkalihalobacillus alcalophilus ATCC 27647 = CGMCC 1.3604]